MQAVMEAARIAMTPEGAAPTESTDQLRNAARLVLESHSALFNRAKKQCNESEQQIASDFDIIRNFNDDNPIIKTAMHRLANIQGHRDRYIQQAANLIKLNPTIKQFYESTQSLNEGDTQVESGPSRDTGDIIQKRHSFLDSIPDKKITDLAIAVKDRASTGSHSLDKNLYIIVRGACNKIKLNRDLFSKYNVNQMKRTYGTITKDEAVNAALELKNVLNDDGFIDKTLIAPYRTAINQYYQNAGLS